MAVIQNNAFAAVPACHPAGVLRCNQLKQDFVNNYWGGNSSALQSGGAQTVSSLTFAVHAGTVRCWTREPRIRSGGSWF
jgi:hypothetical protein